MDRILFSHLKTWLNTSVRKPLVLRGARQVGKTWIVRELAKKTGKKLIELNFEKDPSLASLFDTNDPKQILLNLSALYQQDISLENTLLFLDEIQAAPTLLSKLRWFAEDLPLLPVVAAGSLLEFVLAEHQFSMPVGRINYMHLEPLSFEEFLLANHQANLLDYLNAFNFKTTIPAAIHHQLTLLFKEYILIGGLPAVVHSWVTERSLIHANQIQHDLLATYRDDFSKFKGRLAIERLDEVMMAIPAMLGKKFIYSHVNASIPSNTVKQVLNLLNKARIAHRISGCAANGVPLAAEIKEKQLKAIFLDTGLACAALGLNFTELNATDEIILVNQGSIAEQVVGQLLRTINPPFVEPALYYWLREEKQSKAELDYIIQHENHVIPIEVKAGSTGRLKSLHVFMGLKKYPLAVRINSDIPSQTDIHVTSSLKTDVNYTLMSIPFYLVGQLHRLIGHTLKMNAA
jgi:uncharacterized protein